MKKILLLSTLFLGAHLMADNVQYVQLDNGYKVWTKRVGHGPIKILTLHGGPGCTHEYIENAFEQLFSPDACEIIYYDQLGSAFSDQPDDVSLWTVERFREEVEQVRAALGLTDFYLYGQSWGGMLAIDYALKYQHHLKGLILSNTPGSIPSFESYIQELRDALPQEVQDALSVYENRGDYTNPAYQQLMVENVYTRHVCRLAPWPKEVVEGLQKINEKIYHTMQGPNEFIISGNFKYWDHWEDFASIRVPTLVISGRYDTINPADTLKMASLLPQGRAKICENGSHLCLYDDQESYMEALNDFLGIVP